MLLRFRGVLRVFATTPEVCCAHSGLPAIVAAVQNLFHERFGDNYIDTGAGKTITINTLP
jgi:hypothetical protein